MQIPPAVCTFYLRLNVFWQYSKLAKTETIVNELFCENSHLMKALQLTEARQKQAEKKWKDEVEKTEILAKLLHHISPKVV